MKEHSCKESEKEEGVFIGLYVDSWQLGIPTIDGFNYEYVYIKYCPWCGVKLK